jgi:hypothetical protein
MLRLNGQKDEDRRAALERGEWAVDDADLAAGTAFIPSTWGEYRKRTTTFATRMTQAFEVDTIEGLHTGKAGDWLAIGIHGEMYPIDADVFAATHEEVE